MLSSVLVSGCLAVGLSPVQDALPTERPTEKPTGESTEQPSAEAFEIAAAEIGARFQAQDWAGVQAGLETLFTVHERSPRTFAARPQLEEYAHWAAFWMEHELPTVGEIVSGDLRRYDPQTGKIEVHYTEQDLEDFHKREEQEFYFEHAGAVGEGDMFRHPLQFGGPYTVTLRGRKYPSLYDDDVPRLLVNWSVDSYTMVYPGFPKPGGPVEQKWLPARIAHVARGAEFEILDEHRSPTKAGKPYTFKVQVQKTKIVAFFNGKKILTAKKVDDGYGVVGFTGVEDLEEFVLEGRAEPAWLQSAVDAEIHERWEAFAAETDVEALLPEWLSIEERDWKIVHDLHDFPDELSETKASWFQKLLQRLADSGPQAAEKFLAKRGENTPQTLVSYARAILHDYRGEYEEGLQRIEEVLAAGPDFLSGRRLYVDLCAGASALEEAKIEAETLALSDPEDSFAHSRLVLIALLGQDLKQAASAVLTGAQAGAYDGRLDQINRTLVRASHGPSWRETYVYASEHYLVRSDIDRATCEQAAERLEKGLARFQVAFQEVELRSERFPVFLFSGEEGYQDYVQDVIGTRVENTAGLYHPLIKQLLIWNLPGREEMYQTVRHEGFHQYLDAIAGDTPTWFNEGLAEYWEQADFTRMRSRQAPVRDDHLKTLLGRRTKLTPLSEFVYQRSGAFRAESQLHYAQAWALVHFLQHSSRKNKELFGALLGHLVTGSSRAEALQATFGEVDLAALQEELLEHLRELAE